MATQATDCRFDWCDQLLEVRENFTYEECCNIIKQELRKLRGADEDYVATVTARPTREFAVGKVYVPVYETTITATYTWDTSESDVSHAGDFEMHTTTTTTHTKTNQFNRTFWAGVYKELKVNVYAGRNDQRFYTLSHVADLDGGIYNDSCVYSVEAMEKAVQQAAKESKPSEAGLKTNVLVNQWSCTACMVPIILVDVVYKQQKHRWYFNAHNGEWVCGGYLVSQRVATAADEAVNQIRIPHIATYLISALSMILSFATMDWKSHWFATLLSLAISIIGGIIIIVQAASQNRAAILNEFGQTGPNVKGQYKTAIGILIASVCVMAWVIFSAIVW